MCNATFAHETVKTNNEIHQKIPYKYIIAGLGATAIAIPAIYFFIKAFSDTAGSLGNTRYDPNVQSWKNVSHWYYLAAECEKKRQKNCQEERPEYFECLADSFRCLLNLDNTDKKKLEDWGLKAFEYFRIASDQYSKKADIYANDITSYDYQINSAKAAETLAKSEECLIALETSINRRKSCADLWEKLKGRKPSYNAYAKAKQAEYSSSDYEYIASAWEAVKNDQDLKDSFSENSWEAYRAFAEANRQEWLLKCNKSNRETVYQSWMRAYEKDKICSANCFIYNAFAAEAYQKAQDALKT